MPTTAGTGSEVARGAIVIVDDGRKLGFHSWHLVPKTAICDPELTLGLPPFLTAATGMDAIAHCMETFMAPAVNPPADGIAPRRPRARLGATSSAPPRDGSDREARLNMMSASMQGAMAFQKGLGCVHSLSHSLGGADPRLHHGTLNAMFLPAVVQLQRQRAESMRRTGAWSAWRTRWACAMRDDAGDAVAEAIRDMNARLGLPSGLAALGVERAMFERIIDGAMADHCHKTNPRLATRDDYARMLEDVDVDRRLDRPASGRRLDDRAPARRSTAARLGRDRRVLGRRRGVAASARSGVRLAGQAAEVLAPVRLVDRRRASRARSRSRAVAGLVEPPRIFWNRQHSR